MISTTVVRRLPVYGSVNAGKAATLARMGSELDRVRTVVWARFSGVKSGHLSKRQIRDRLMAEDAPAGFVVPQRLWRAAVEDTVDKIRAFHQAVITTEVRPKIYGHAGDDKAERKRLLVLARSGRWREDPWLSRQIRKAFADRTPRPRAACTSQQVHPCGHLGVRRGRNVHCQTAGCPQQGIVFDTEINAARVIRDRATDPQISRYTPTQEVKRILIERAGTVENCPTTTQANTLRGGGCERNNSFPTRTTTQKR